MTRKWSPNHSRSITIELPGPGDKTKARYLNVNRVQRQEYSPPNCIRQQKTPRWRGFLLSWVPAYAGMTRLFSGLSGKLSLVRSNPRVGTAARSVSTEAERRACASAPAVPYGPSLKEGETGETMGFPCSSPVRRICDARVTYPCRPCHPYRRGRGQPGTRPSATPRPSQPW